MYKLGAVAAFLLSMMTINTAWAASVEFVSKDPAADGQGAWFAFSYRCNSGKTGAISFVYPSGNQASAAQYAEQLAMEKCGEN